MEILLTSFYKKALDSSFDGILITDGSGKIIYVNSQYEKITGLERKDIIDKNLSALLKDGTRAFL